MVSTYLAAPQHAGEKSTGNRIFLISGIGSCLCIRNASDGAAPALRRYISLLVREIEEYVPVTWRNDATLRALDPPPAARAITCLAEGRGGSPAVFRMRPNGNLPRRVSIQG